MRGGEGKEVEGEGERGGWSERACGGEGKKVQWGVEGERIGGEGRGWEGRGWEGRGWEGRVGQYIIVRSQEAKRVPYNAKDTYWDVDGRRVDLDIELFGVVITEGLRSTGLPGAEP